jgi:hypothetical protein
MSATAVIAPVPSIDLTDPQGTHWDGRDWSDWYPMEDALKPRQAKAPNVPGVYRLRCAGQPGLIYIGETGRSLRGRLRQLCIAMKDASLGKPPGPPHVAGACVFKHTTRGFKIQVSWHPMAAEDHCEIKGVECELIGTYRKRMHQSPMCQFAGGLE